jgi:16S rRNA (guanine527-N7)-methyltransferase
MAPTPEGCAGGPGGSPAESAPDSVGGAGDGAPPPATLYDVLGDARARGLLGGAALDDQVAHALGFARAYEAVAAGTPPAAPQRWMDLGSGGGLPGLVLAGHWPSAVGVLLDAARRRARFLEEAVGALGWQERLEVRWARAEDAGRDAALRSSFDLVVARSFGPPAVTAECAAPFLHPGGLLVVSEPPDDVAAEDRGPRPRWPGAELAALGLRPEASVRSRAGYQVLRQVEPCPDRFPRRPGMPEKRPLYR